MSKQFHFNIYYDDELKQFCVDDEDCWYNPKSVWDTESEEWLSRAEDEELRKIDYEIFEQLLDLFAKTGEIEISI
jgi:sulfur relay (sulfurtransferase) DsrC/TusE family protein